jgi:glycosyltransferase involved in cell wall biosynthesis
LTIADDRRPAIVHDFFIQDGGAERCAVEFARLLPAATIETTFFDVRQFSDRIDPGRVRTWPLQRLLGPTRHFRALLPLYPIWFMTRDLRDRDLVISSSVAFCKAVRTRRDAIHVSYVYTPMRYAWDLDTYLAGSSLSMPGRLAARTIRPLLRRWDRMTAKRAGVIVAISETVRDRIRETWGREAVTVIYPPVDTSEIAVSDRDDGFLLVAARLLAYRRIDLAVAAATSAGRDLIVVGEGPELERLQAGAGPSVRFMGRVDRTTLLDLFARCHAYLVPGEEDFGIAPVEAMAAGKPVVALRAGGARETVIDGVTGVLFDRPVVDDLIEALDRLDSTTWDPAALRAQAERFDTAVFVQRWRVFLVELGGGALLDSAG